LKQSEADHLVFYCHIFQGKCLYHMVYVDDIAIIVNDIPRITQLKKHLFSHFLDQRSETSKIFYCHWSGTIKRMCHHFTKKICSWQWRRQAWQIASPL